MKAYKNNNNNNMYPSVTKINNIRPRSSLSTIPSSSTLPRKKNIRNSISSIFNTRKLTNLEKTLISITIILIIINAVIFSAIVFIGKTLALQQEADSINLQFENNDLSNIPHPKRKLVVFNPTTLHNYNSQHDERNSTVKNINNFNSTTSIDNNNKVNKIMSNILQKLTFRLPKEIKPIKYDLFLYPNLNLKTFSGNVTILLNILNPINYIPIHSKKLTITSTSVIKLNENISDNYGTGNSSTLSQKLLSGDSGDGVNIEPLKTFEYEPFEYWVTEFKENLSEGDYLLNLHFNGSLTDRIVGFYQSSYFDSNSNQTRWIATSKFEPTFARQAFPCFDEPAMKANFKVTLVRPTHDNYSALSNMDVEKEIPEGDTTKVVFKESVKMSTYVSCFIVSDFKHKEQIINAKGIGNDFNMRVFATPAQLNKVDFALQTGAKVTEYYIQYFKTAYPLPKLDMAAIPDFVSGAMEHWGLVTFRETALLYDPKTSSTANKQRVGTVVAHELAHMWFGNLVTMKWWNDLWLNEGFATYIEYKGIDHTYPDWKVMDIFIIDEIQSVFGLDSSLASHPIVQTVENPDQITELFDPISYAKAASVIRMLEDFVGQENFQKAVTKYLDKYKYGNAVTDDLLTEIDSLGLDFDVKEIMQTWTEQMGFPVIQVTKISDTEYKITQKRFLSNPEDEKSVMNDSPFNYRWTVPITYFTNNNNAVQHTWFKHSDTEERIKLDKPADWIKINKNQVGYYRVNYDIEMWDKLSKALIADKSQFSISDRGHLLNDIFNLADATHVPYNVALDLTKYLANENEYVPWSVAASKLGALRNLLYYSDAFEDLLKYSRNLLDKIYKQVGWQITNDHSENLLRTTILGIACSLGHEECLNEAANRFVSWIKKPEDRPNPDLRSVIYQYGLKKTGSAEYWNTMWDLYKTESDANEKVKLMSALAGIESSWILKKYVDLAWDENNVRGQDYFTCLGYIAANPAGESIVWEYVRENWPKFVKRFGLNERYMGKMIPTITGKFSTNIKLQEMQQFFQMYPEAGAGESARKQALANVKNNIKWLENNKSKVAEWLKKQ